MPEFSLIVIIYVCSCKRYIKIKNAIIRPSFGLFRFEVFSRFVINHGFTYFIVCCGHDNIPSLRVSVNLINFGLSGLFPIWWYDGFKGSGLWRNLDYSSFLIAKIYCLLLPQVVLFRSHCCFVKYCNRATEYFHGFLTFHDPSLCNLCMLSSPVQ